MKQISYDEWYGLIQRIGDLESKIDTCLTSIIVISCLLLLALLVGAIFLVYSIVS